MTTKNEKKTQPKTEPKKAPVVAPKAEPKKAPVAAPKAEPKKGPAAVPSPAAPLVKPEAKPVAEKAKPVDSSNHCHVAWRALGPALELALAAGNAESKIVADTAVRLEIVDQTLNVQAGTAPDLFFEVNVSIEAEATLEPVFVNAKSLLDLFQSKSLRAGDVVSLGRAADGKKFLLGLGTSSHELPTVSGEGFVTPLLADGEECDDSADLVYDAALLRSALDWTLKTVPDAKQPGVPHGVVFDGDAMLGMEGKRLNIYPKMPEPFARKGSKVAASGKTPVLPTRAASLLSSCVELLDADEVPATFMHVAKRGDFFAFQIATSHFGAVVVAKSTGEKVGNYRLALPKGKPVAGGTVQVEELKKTLKAAAKQGVAARLTLTQNGLMVETVAEDKTSRSTITLLKRSGQKATNGLFVSTSRWINPGHLDESLDLLLAKTPENIIAKIDVILPLADELRPDGGVLALQDPDGRISIVAPIPGDKALVERLIAELAVGSTNTEPAKKPSVVVPLPVAKPGEKKVGASLVKGALPAHKAREVHQPA